MASASSSDAKSIYDFVVKDARGNDVDVSQYKGKMLLIVNVASQCGLTNSNYTELSELYTKYKDQGLEILAFPCNQFDAQGSNDQIVEYACTRFKAEFPVFDKVDDKYQYSCNNEDLKVHGWICTEPPTGFWQITPSNAFRSGGLTKQNLTSHVGPTNLAIFYSAHYVGEDMVTRFADGEYWKRVFGPVFMYFNCVPKEDDWHWL